MFFLRLLGDYFMNRFKKSLLFLFVFVVCLSSNVHGMMKIWKKTKRQPECVASLMLNGTNLHISFRQNNKIYAFLSLEFKSLRCSGLSYPIYSFDYEHKIAKEFNNKEKIDRVAKLSFREFKDIKRAFTTAKVFTDWIPKVKEFIEYDNGDQEVTRAVTKEEAEEFKLASKKVLDEAKKLFFDRRKKNKK